MRPVSGHFNRRAMVAAVLACLSGGGQAQQAHQAEADSRTLGRVVVSAEQDKPVQERTELGRLTPYTPISGSVVDSAELEHLQLVNNLLELGKRVPGISMIRNMRIPDGGKLYTENRIDGMRASSNNTSVLDEVSSAELERVEIITGPASALYGSGALGGTISAFTRQPPRQAAGRVSQEFGSFGFQRSQGQYGASTKDGKLGFIVTGSVMHTDGWRLSPAPASRDAAQEHREGLSFRGQWRITDSTTLSIGQSQLHSDFRWAGPLRVNLFSQDWRQTEAGTYGQYIDRYQTTSFRLQHLTGNGGELTLAHMRVADDQINNGNGGSGGANNVICDDTSALLAPLAAGTTVKCRAVNNNSAANTNTVKLGNTVTKTTLAMFRQDFERARTTAYVGGELVDISSDSSTYANSFNALQAQSGMWAQGAMTATGQGSLSGTTETTPFVHVEFSPVDRLRFHLGERFGRINYTVDDRTAANRDVSMMRKGNVMRAGVTWELDRDHLVWANWGETFNPQSTGSLINSATVGTAGNVIGAVLNPERGLTKELGFRGHARNVRLRYDVTFFTARTEGFIVTRTCSAAEQAALNAGAACTINENSGQLASDGLESMWTWAATPWLDVGATYTHSRAWFTKFVSTTFDFTGKSYQAMPRHKLNLRLGVKPMAGMLVELEADHLSSYFVDNTNLRGSYARPDLFNLRASYTPERMGGWSFWGHIINLTDRQYATRMQLSTVAGVGNVLATQAGQGNAGTYTPRALRAGVALKF